jgi:hypothetical protein
MVPLDFSENERSNMNPKLGGPPPSSPRAKQPAQKECAVAPSSEEVMQLRLEAACHFAETGARVAMGYIRLLKEKLEQEMLERKIFQEKQGENAPSLVEVLDTIYWCQERMLLEIEKLEGE